MSTPSPAPGPRIRHGHIVYRGADGREVGNERFELVDHAGGHVLRALCRIDEGDLLRDVTLSMDRAWLPEEGYCRILRGGTTEAALWFRVAADGVRIDASIRGEPLPEHFLPTRQRLPYLGLHPLQGDALIVEQRGTADPGQFHAIETVTNSVSPNGDEATAGVHLFIEAAYIGEEVIEVTAGRFPARRYALRWREDWPPADLWVRREDNLFLLMRWSMIPTWYELAHWHEERPLP
jgi:hypothetical protein